MLADYWQLRTGIMCQWVRALPIIFVQSCNQLWPSSSSEQLHGVLQLSGGQNIFVVSLLVRTGDQYWCHCSKFLLLTKWEYYSRCGCRLLLFTGIDYSESHKRWSVVVFPFWLPTIFRWVLEGVNDYFSKRTQVEKAVKAQDALATVEGKKFSNFLPFRTNFLNFWFCDFFVIL